MNKSFIQTSLEFNEDFDARERTMLNAATRDGVEISQRTRTIPVPRSRNITDVAGLYPLQQSLVIGSYVKRLVHEVLSDR